MASYKRIRYRNKASAQELVSEGSRWYKDSDVGKSIIGAGEVTGLSFVEYGTIIKAQDFSSHPEFPLLFAYFKCTELIDGDEVSISLDGTQNWIITLLAGEGFSAQLMSGAAPRISVGGASGSERGVSTVEYLIGK